MSLKRLEPEDFLLSTEAIIAGAFAGGSSAPTNGGEANSGVSANYYKAYNGSDGKLEYTVASYDGGGTDEEKSIYGAIENILGKTPTPAAGTVIAIERSRFKQSIFPNTFKLGTTLADTSSVTFTNAGREYSVSSSTLHPDVGICLDAATSTAAKTLIVDSEEVITSNYIFIRARNAEFNYSTNPSFVDPTTGGVLYTDFITAPQTFITTVGLYNDNGDLLAVAKLSKPLKKDFTKEALIRVKLDF